MMLSFADKLTYFSDNCFGFVRKWRLKIALKISSLLFLSQFCVNHTFWNFIYLQRHNSLTPSLN